MQGAECNPQLRNQDRASSSPQLSFMPISDGMALQQGLAGNQRSA